MKESTLNMIIAYYQKARKGDMKSYDKLIDKSGGLHKKEAMELMNALTKILSRECLLDLIIYSLCYDNFTYREQKRRKITQRFGAIYHWPNFEIPEITSTG